MLLFKPKMLMMKKNNCKQRWPHTPLCPCVGYSTAKGIKLLTSANQSKTVSNFLSKVSDCCRWCARSLETLKKKIPHFLWGPERKIVKVKPSMKMHICQLYREPPNSLCLINMTMEITSSVLCRLLISLSLAAGFVCFFIIQ